MVSDFIFSYEQHVLTLAVIHVAISFFLAIFLSLYTMKRFIRNTKEVKERDAARLKEIVSESKMFRLLFKVSLHKNNLLSNITFMFLFIFSIPVVGYAFAIWIAWYLNNVNYERKVSNTNILNLDEFGMSFLKVERIFGEGSMSELLRNEHAPKSKKLKALSALANNASPANLSIIRQTLSSTDDEIRMFGYAIINKAEKSLNVRISENLDLYNKRTLEDEEIDDTKVAEAAKELAHLYWEMVYTELSHESLKDGFLEEVVRYIEIAKKYYIPETRKIREELESTKSKIREIESLEKEDFRLATRERIEPYLQTLDKAEEKFRNYNNVCIKLYVLRGRVYMNKKDYAKANVEFTVAHELDHSESSFILPYLAEIRFLTGYYKGVKSIMNRARGLKLNYTLYPIVEQWKAS